MLTVSPAPGTPGALQLLEAFQVPVPLEFQFFVAALSVIGDAQNAAANIRNRSFDAGQRDALLFITTAPLVLRLGDVVQNSRTARRTRIATAPPNRARVRQPTAARRRVAPRHCRPFDRSSCANC